MIDSECKNEHTEIRSKVEKKNKFKDKSSKNEDLRVDSIDFSRANKRNEVRWSKARTQLTKTNDERAHDNSGATRERTDSQRAKTLNSFSPPGQEQKDKGGAGKDDAKIKAEENK